MKMNWRTFLFLMCILLVALIMSNMFAGGIKVEGFEEGATSLEDTCRKGGIPKADFEGLKKTVEDKKGAVWKDASNINFDVVKIDGKYKANCDLYIKEIARTFKPAAAAAPKPAAAKPKK